MKYDLHVLAQLATGVGSGVDHIFAVDIEVTARRRLDHGNQTRQRGLSATGFTYHGQRAARGQFEVCPIERFQRFFLRECVRPHLVVAAQIPGAKQCFSHLHCPPVSGTGNVRVLPEWTPTAERDRSKRLPRLHNVD